VACLTKRIKKYVLCSAVTVYGSVSCHGVDEDFKLICAVLEMVGNTLPLALNTSCLPAHDPVDRCRIVAPV